MLGASYLLRGFGMLTQKGLKRFVFIPIIINIIIFILFFLLAKHYFSVFIHFTNSVMPNWMHWLNWLLWPLFVLTFLVAVLYGFTLIANLIAAPFNSFLSEKVELIVQGEKNKPDTGILAVMKDIPRAMARELLKIRYYLPRIAVLLLLSFIPGVNIIAPIAWAIFGCWMMAMQYVDYAMDNHKVTLQDTYKRMQCQPIKYLVFGGMVTLAMMIPVLDLFVIPAAVIGGTLMFLDQYGSSL